MLTISKKRYLKARDSEKQPEKADNLSISSGPSTSKQNSRLQSRYITI